MLILTLMLACGPSAASAHKTSLWFLVFFFLFNMIWEVLPPTASLRGTCETSYRTSRIIEVVG